MKALTWFIKNPVAANVLMGLIIISGLVGLFAVEKEVFPRFSQQRIDINAFYPGGSPEEIEQRICIPIEEAIHNLPGITRLNTTAGQTDRKEAVCAIHVQAAENQDLQTLIGAIQARIQNIPHLPKGMDRIEVKEGRASDDDGVIWVALYGQTDLISLVRIGEEIKAALSRIPGVEEAENYGYIPYELAIEIPSERLRRSKLTLSEIADAVRQSSLNLPGGLLKTQTGDIVLQTQGQAIDKATFGSRVLLSSSHGNTVRLQDIATIRDGLAEQNFSWHHNGLPAQGWAIYAKQDEVAVARRVKAYVTEMAPRLPEGLKLIYWYDDSQAFDERVRTLLENGLLGFLLIFLLLTLFLNRQLAIWVAAGLATALLSALAGMWVLGVSLNMLSLFGFVLALGILVDDTIIVSESINRHQNAAAQAFTGTEPPRLRKKIRRSATIDGVKEVAGPVTLAVVTTGIAFLPGLFLHGWADALLGPICMVMVLALGFSLVEALCILPAHLTAAAPISTRWMATLRHRVTRGLEAVIHHGYLPFLDRSCRQPYLIIAFCASAIMITAALVSGGHVRLAIQADVPKDTITLYLDAPAGAPFSTVQKLSTQIEEAYKQLRHSLETRQPPDEPSPVSGIESMIFDHWSGFWVELAPGARQRFSVETIAREWREYIGDIGKAKLDFLYRQGDNYYDLEWAVSATDSEIMPAALAMLTEHLSSLPGVFDVMHSHIKGKPQLSLELRPEAERLGVRLEDVATQVRQAYLGEEVQRFQRQREQVKVVVRLPLNERRDFNDFRQLPILLPTGDQAPLEVLAKWRWLPQTESITRQNRQQLVWVRARLNPELADANAIYATMQTGFFENLKQRFPGLSINVGQTRQDQMAAFETLGRNALFAVGIIYALLAVSFRSFRYPVLILLAIPMAWVGGVLAHFLLGLPLSMESLVGMIGASGVVINDSLVLLNYVQRRKRKETALSPQGLIFRACEVRFLPIVLTFLTTLVGLVPMLFETSAQAQFLVPMAVALAAGLFGGLIATLLLVPATTLILEGSRPQTHPTTLSSHGDTPEYS
ncbi:MAG: acriflavin resistance protein [Nitrospirales bacterium]|nr:MAG: acriflavin resistance protein [Nitrospirales bacterium]